MSERLGVWNDTGTYFTSGNREFRVFSEYRRGEGRYWTAEERIGGEWRPLQDGGLGSYSPGGKVAQQRRIERYVRGAL